LKSHNITQGYQLVKSVTQAIPAYVMGVFKLPMTLCEESTQIIRYFWWVRKKVIGRYIGWLERNSSCQNILGGWASEICGFSFKHCWIGKLGGVDSSPT
jgi:hypothetical protein